MGERYLLLWEINGSLGDVETALKEAGITYHIFNEVESNPSVQTVRKAAQLGRDIGAEFVVGIGGGSPMDAAKAIAVLCTNDIEDSALFANQYTKPLPIVAVTTTSGTGSEVTQYAVLTNPAVGTKMGISTKETQLMSTYAASVICLQESRIHPDRQAVLRGYHTYTKDRIYLGLAAGGVTTFVRTDLYSVELPLRTQLEAIAVRVALPNLVTICNLYISPGVVLNRLDLLDLIAELPQPFILLGDFNAHHPLWGSESESPRGREVEDIISNLDLCVLNTGEATHFNIASGTSSSALALCAWTCLLI